MAHSVPSETSIPDEFTCKICLAILKKPVQCQRNEHYFCTVCISKHLKRSQSCPLCKEKLTTETLRLIPRVVADLLSQIETPSCKYVQRGCTEKIKYQNQAIHHQVCGFAPVVCSNEGCGETVNKQDQASHEKESCQFRKTKCEVCKEEMFHRNYAKHSCVLRQEVDEMKLSLVEISSILKEIQKELPELKGDRKPIRNFPEPVEPTSSSSLRSDRKQFLSGQQPLKLEGSSSSNSTRVSGQIVVKSSLVETNSCLKKMREELTQLKGDRKPINNLPEPIEPTSSSSSRSDRKQFLSGHQPLKLKDSSSSYSRHVSGQIVVAGGNDEATMRSYEVFNWATKSWTLFEDALFFDHCYSFSFPYNNNIMICGGVKSNKIERLDFNNSRCTYAFPSSLPSNDFGKGVLSGDEIITFGDSVSKTVLKPPYSSKCVKTYPDKGKRQFYGTERVNESAVVVGGTYECVGYQELRSGKFKEYLIQKLTDHVLLCNSVKNELKQLAPLPYRVSHMATVPYKDNIIILGGQENASSSYNSVIMYNITNQECKMLPSMLEKRSGCTAVIMGEVIVVMGGNTAGKYVKALNTVEYLVLGEDTWKELPSMHCARIGATASVQV